MHHRPPVSASAQPPPDEAPPPPEAAGGFLDTFLARSLANSLSMVGVAAGVLWYVGSQNAVQQAQVDALRDEVALLRLERDRMQSVAGELAREVHDAGMESEIVRWQLAYTEERLRRAEAAAVPLPAAPAAAPPERASVALGGGPAGPGPFRKAVFQPLDAPAMVALGGDPLGLALPPEAAGTGAPADDSAVGGPLVPVALRLDELEPEIPALAAATSQHDRDRAYGVWAGIVHAAVASECGRKLTETGQHRCARDLHRELRPYANAAVDCILSGNATPDYFAELDPGRVPTHAVPLDRGVVLLCDGALPNL